MTTLSTATLQMRAIPAETLRRLRAQEHDDHGHPLVARVDGEGGEPLRCCLRNSRPGEEIALIAYAPVRASIDANAGPNDEVGPLFVHADECDGYVDDGHYPHEWAADRPQTLRAYRADGSIHGGVRLDPGEDRDAAATALLADPDVAFIHSRNVVYGCYMLEIRRG